MYLVIVLEILAFALLLMGVINFAGLRVHRSRKRTIASALFAGALVCILVCVVLNVGNLLQNKTGVNLFLPSDFQTNARIWMRQHENQQPQSGQVGNNMRIVADGQVFFKAYKQNFNPEALLKMEPVMKLGTRLDHMLSFAEEQQYLEAAQTVVAVIGAAAGTQGTGGK